MPLNVTGSMMEYNTAYHLHCEITLHSGRSIILEKLDQKLTYAGLIEGVPFTSLNDRHVEWALETARTKCINNSEPLLIAPDRRDYLRDPGDMNIVPSRRGLRPEWLPMVQCIAGFSSISPTNLMGGSYLVVVWFQNEFALPIDNAAMEKIESIDWKTTATDYEY